jgi:hypothetical protein
MTRLIAIVSFAAAIAALTLAAPQQVFAAKKKAAAKPACVAGALCTGACNAAKWCNVQVCSTDGKMTPTLGFCFEGSVFCPPKC